MSKMNIVEAAEHFGISKEAIHNRIRRGSLSCIVEDGVKFVMVDKSNSTPKPRAQIRKATNSSDDKYYKLLEEQNTKLQEKVDKLESETRSLRDQKEQMLIDERSKIEQIYQDKDEQLKNILTSFKAQFLIAPQKEEEHLDAEIEEVKEIAIIKEKEEVKTLGVVSLKKYLKDSKLSEKKIQKIKDKFKKRAKKDERVIIVGKKYYLDLDKYDYKDLVK